ncbi:MAG: sulfatase-like hydrolase/transferase [Planctomycetota bacterium JB042]
MPLSRLLPLFLLLLATTCAPPPVRRNVLLISIDTLRWDRLGSTGHAGAATPNLDRLAASGTLFTNGVAPTPLTLPSHATMFTGKLPIEHGVRDNAPFRLPERHDTLTTTFAERGYRTAAVVGAAPLAAGCGLERDFETYDDDFGAQATGTVVLAERRADAVTDAAIERLAVDDERPFFLFVHYFDPHAPYAPPAPFAADFAGAPYDGEVAFVDREIGRLLTALDRSGAAAETLVVVTSDHGEALGEHGEDAHGFFLYDCTIRVPVIVRDPGAPAGGVEETQVRHQDLRAFVEARAADRPADLAAPGRRGEPAFVESLYGAIHCDHAQLRGLRSPRGTKLLEACDVEFYDLGADPDEEQDLAPGDPRVAPALAALDGALDSLRRDRSEGGGAALPGYLSTPLAPELLATRSREENCARPSPASRRASIAALQDGVRQLEAGLLQSACETLGAGVADDPENPALRFWHGRALRAAAAQDGDRERLVEAERAFADVVRLRPDHAQARDLRLHSLVLLGRYDEAKRLADALAAGDPAPRSLEAAAILHLTPRGAFAEADNPHHDPAAAAALLERALEAGEDARIRARLEECYRR